MLVLGIDTSGKSGGITLAEGDSRSFRAIETAPIAGGTFSAQLVPTVASLLQRHGFAAPDTGGFAVVSGPGSFTGLRVGLSAVKGLAEALAKPIAAVSLLECLATLSRECGSVLAALDAGRKEVFCGLYEVSGGKAAKVREELLSQAEFLQQAGGLRLKDIITTDVSLAELATTTARDRLHLVDCQGSEVVARVGLRKLLAGDTVATTALDANYIRRSDAGALLQGRAMIHVRPARKTDVPRMMEIARQSTFAAQWKEDAYLRLLAAQGQPCVGLVAEENETVLGFLFARRVGGGVWEVENVAVYEPARRRGLASHLLDEFIELARSGAGNAIYLEVRESNQAACALYQKHGFLKLEYESRITKILKKMP